MSQSAPQCFWQDATAQDSPLFLISGTWLCQLHARCFHCAMPLLEILGSPIRCVCDADYGVLEGHAEALWCSITCMESSHPEPPEQEPEEEP